ncbi:MAG TPA: amidohydrolase family protein [Candidatus Methylomirabilis sp.]|nr:amidohydrolase family protein [Candidatus Methylomirabilis sp.]
MLFTCPGDVARGGDRRTVRGGRRHVCVDVHCHVHYPPADEMVKHAYVPEQEPAARFSNALSRATNQKQMQNVHVCLTSVEQRLRDMDRMGVDVQAISCSPFQFKYSLDPELGGKAARAINEHLAEIVQKHPTRFVALANVPLQAPDAAAGELEYCVKRLGFRGVEIGTNVAGQEISRGRDAFWAKAQDLDVMVFMHPNGFTGGERLAEHYFINAIGNPLDSTVAVGYLVFDGVLERFPKLKIVVAHGGGYVSHYPGRMDHVWGARADARTALKKTPRWSLAKLYFDTIVFDREQLRHLVNLWGADHIVVGTDYPYDMGWYDPRGFVGGADFLKDADKARILGLNAARLLKITGRLGSMGIPASPTKPRKT